MREDKGRLELTEQFLDTLLDALIERNNLRKRGEQPARPAPVARQETAAVSTAAASAAPPIAQRAAPRAGEAGWVPAPPAASIGVGRTLWRLLLLVLALALVVNIPVAAHGISLARLLPDRDALVIRDGLVLKEANSPEIYVLGESELHWVPSLTAFDQLGLQWSQVHEVDAGFMSQFTVGEPSPRLIKCENQPHVYRVNADGTRSWIVDIDTFVAEGYVWDEVMALPCDEVGAIPRGETVPPGRGEPGDS